MKSWILRSLIAVALAAVVVAGCQSANSGANAGNSTTTTGNSSSSINDDAALGFFVEGGNDIEGGGPPPPTSNNNQADGDDESEETQSHFRRIQVDPGLEDTAGAKFVKAADIDGDGLMDLASAHNQSLPVQIHLQRRDAEGNISFKTVQIGGTSPVAVVAGLEIADIDGDGRLDLVVLSKATGFVETCGGMVDPDNGILDGLCIVYFQPQGGDVTDGDQWNRADIATSSIRGSEVPDVDFQEVTDRPEYHGYTGLAVGDANGDGMVDIFTAINADSCGFTGHGFQQGVGESAVELFLNPGATASRNGGSWATPVRVNSNVDDVYVKDIALSDIDGDGLLDFVLTRPIALGGNIRWYRNPGGNIAGAGLWSGRPIGHIQPTEEGADKLAIGDMDGDGADDVMVRAGKRGIVQWFRRPTADTSIDPALPPNSPLPQRFDFPWQVFTLDEVSPFRPAGIAIGDLTNDGRNDAVVAVGGALFWYDPSLVGSNFDEWGRDFVLDDTKEQGTTDDPRSADFVDTGTQINSLVVVDIDGDGVNDVVATFDRRVNSGLNEDAIYWFRNTLFDVQTTDN